MVVLNLSDRALLQVRIAPHALWEIMASASLLARHRTAAQFPYRGWIRGAMTKVLAGQGAALVRWAAEWPRHEFPCFLMPQPENSVSALGEACRELRLFSPDLVRERLRSRYATNIPAAFRLFDTNPRAALDAMADAVDEYAAAILEPQWAAITQTLKEELSAKALILASSGADELMRRLHGRIRWSRPDLTIEVGQRPVLLAPEEVALVPLLFIRDQAVIVEAGDGRVAIGYQARGLTNLAMRLVSLPSRAADRLELLLGKTRASVLLSLHAPSTTTALAQSLHLAPSTVSEHLSVLASCRIAVRARRANCVYYTLSEQGAALLRAFYEGES